jgi:hypothetical protein
MSMRPSRKLHNLNVWQRGIQQHRGTQRTEGVSVEPRAQRGWAKAFFRRLLGRRAATIKGAAPPRAFGLTGAPGSSGSRAAAKQAVVRSEISESMLSRLATVGKTDSLSRMTQAGDINVTSGRDLRFWQRGKEFVAAACGGFDTGAGPAYVAERRMFWRQRSQRRAAPVARGPAAAATQSLRLLLRSLARGADRDQIGQASASLAQVAGGSRRTNKQVVRPTVAAAAGLRRTKSFRDQKVRQQGFRLLKKAFRIKQGTGPQSKASLAMYRAASGWTPGGAPKSPDAPGPASKQG